METLVFVEQHKNHYYSTRSKPHGHARFGSSSSPCRGFRGMNCRTFQSGAGILPSPVKSFSSPKTPTTLANSNFIGNRTPLKTSPKSTPIEINDKTCGKVKTFVNGDGEGLWAGPAYSSNSPPPSSLPIPKFSVVVRPKRTVSLNLQPISCPEIEMRCVAKSAPSSPTGEHSHSTTRDLFDESDADSAATKTLCRILNLNIIEDE